MNYPKCKRGTRRNRKTAECEPYIKKTATAKNTAEKININASISTFSTAKFKKAFINTLDSLATSTRKKQTIEADGITYENTNKYKVILILQKKYPTIISGSSISRILPFVKTDRFNDTTIKEIAKTFATRFDSSGMKLKPLG